VDLIYNETFLNICLYKHEHQIPKSPLNWINKSRWFLHWRTFKCYRLCCVTCSDNAMFAPLVYVSYLHYHIDLTWI